MIDIGSEYFIGLFFIMGYQLAMMVLEVQFDYYYHFVLEEKYGFNK